MRTDEHNNPTAFTVDIAKTASLVEGVDYERGQPFKVGDQIFYTAKLLKDPIDTTLRVIDLIGFYTRQGIPRWVYISIPPFVWEMLPRETKVKVIGFMYAREGGVAMKGLFQ